MAGSITKRGKNAYLLQVSMGSDAEGKPRRFSKTVHTETRKDAEKALAEFYLECEKKKNFDTLDCTVEEFADIWWEEHVSHFTKISTRSGYKTAIYYHIVPRFGALKIRTLKPLQIQQWINDLKEENLSPKTIKNYFSVLHSLCEYAIKWEYMETNPCGKVTLPKRQKTEASYYSEQDVYRLMKALEQVPQIDMNYKVAIYIALFGGLRKGEILGLNEEDYLRETQELRIVRTRMLGNSIGPYVDTPKTERSARVISIPEEVAVLIDELFRYQADQKNLWGSKWADSKALIKGYSGGAMYPQNLQRWFTRFITRNDLPPLTLHGLRHTHTALLVSMSEDIAQISRRLGHSEITTTLNTYTHLFKNSDKALTAEMSKRIIAKAGQGANAKEDDDDGSKE